MLLRYQQTCRGVGSLQKWYGQQMRESHIIDIIVKGIGNASNFYGRAVYYPNYGTRPPHNGREVRAAVTQLAAGCYSSIVAAFIANRLPADSLVF